LILVTGGTGFLGRHLIPALCRQHQPVRILTRDASQHAWLRQYPNITIYEGDLRDRESLHGVLDGCHRLIHAGGYFRFWGNPRLFDESNAQGTENILDEALTSGEALQKIIHISSIAVIGQPDPTRVIDETYPPHPVDPYQVSKLRAEQIALRYHREHSLPIVVLRPGAYYGPLGEYAFNRLFFKDPMRGIIMQIDGGRYIIFPAYVRDVVQGILLSLQRGLPGEIYNICGDPISHRDAFSQVIEAAQLRWPRLPIPTWLALNTSRLMTAVSAITGQEPFWPINLRSYVFNNWRVSNEKARCDLGFEPTPFPIGAQRTVEWYQAGCPQHIPELDCLP
jgi:dihydroflavonol-4-reductase